MTLSFGSTAVCTAAAYVGKKEKAGPLGDWFDNYSDDTTFGEDSWEKAETQLQKRAMRAAADRAGLSYADIDVFFGGDLQAQCTATAYAVRDAARPFIGLYGACSTLSLALLQAAAWVEASFAARAAAVTSSHFAAAERQFRFPLELGTQRPPTAQWTVTGAGCVIVDRGKGVRITGGTVGRPVDLGVCDINNMGAAMAPAAADSIERHLRAAGTAPADYDAIVTGDLGSVGSDILLELLQKRGLALANHADCGKLIYDLNDDVGAGGSGCGCSASVFCAHYYPRLLCGELRRMLLCATGALMSVPTFQQGESIPGICHVVELTSPR